MVTPTELTPRRAALQLITLLVIFYAAIYGNAALQGSVSLENSNIFLSALSLGSFMLGLTWLMLRRDVNWRASLQVQPMPLLQAFVFGAIAFVIAYSAGAAAMGVYVLLGPELKTQLAAKSEWLSKLSNVPLYAMLPLALFAGFWEEIVFRGFVLNRLSVIFKGDAVRTVITVGVLFGLGHCYQGVGGLLQTSATGMALAAVTMWRKSLWPALIAHASIDAFGLFAIQVLKTMLERVSHQ